MKERLIQWQGQTEIEWTKEKSNSTN